MSTPSTATTTIPAQHSQYGYAQHNPYAANTSSYPANNSVPATRLPTSYHTFQSTTSSYPRNQRSEQSSKQPSHAASMATSQSTSALPRNQKQPDWDEFYKNGVPKEIIVIDDDDSPPPKLPQRTASRRGGKADAPTSATQVPAGKKRKVDQGYEAGYHDSPAFSTHPAKFGTGSSGPSISTDRTTSLQTTAPTSLGSYGSSGASNSYEDVNIGQKRKRAQPQATTRAQTKRKQQDDAFADYIPPPKPPLKAPEVHVPLVQAVCEPFLVLDRLLTGCSICPKVRR